MSDTEDTDTSQDAEDPWAAAMAEQQESEATSDAEKVDLENLKEDAINNNSSSEDPPNLDVIMEVPVVLSMEVGSTKISIRNLLKLSQGSVIELDRFAGDPLDVFVNGNLIAHGEVVVVNEKFGIRLTDILSTAEKIAKLGEN